MLKEFTSLNSKLTEAKKSIAAELERIDKIQTQREERKAQQDQHTIQLDEKRKSEKLLENHLEKTQGQLALYQEQLNQITTVKEEGSLKNQIESAKKNITETEEKLLETIEITESLESEIQAANSFLEGSLETMKEIEAEINKENEEVYQQIKVTNERINYILQELPEPVVKRLEKLKLEQKKYDPLSELSDKNHCVKCGFPLPMALIGPLEKDLKLTSCRGCKRILLPQNIKFL